ncbi:MAG: substrate-binding periplasmic protein, partial [Promethearchaeota archaeon]
MKNKKIKNLVFIIFLLVLPIFFSPVASAYTLDDTSLQDVLDAGVIKVGIEPACPPYEQHNSETDEIEGFDPDVMEYIAADIGVPIQWVNVSWANIFTGLANGDYDCIISAVAITEQRENAMDFSRWYYRDALAIMVNENNTLGIDNIDDINSTEVKVGYQQSTSGEWYLGNEGIIAQKNSFATLTLAVEALKQGDVDVVIGDFISLNNIKTAESELLYIVDTFQIEEFGIPVLTGADSLRLRINSILDEMLGDNLIHPQPNLNYTTSFEKWFGMDPYMGLGAPMVYYTIDASDSDFGNISSEGVIEVLEGADILFRFTPDEGYMTDKVIV